MKPRSVKPLSIEELRELSTPRLLKYLEKLNQCEQSMAVADWKAEDLLEANEIVFKETDAWVTQYEQVKSELEGRPHVEQ